MNDQMTPEFMAPEIMHPEHFGPVCETSDWWSLGVIISEMLTGATPFSRATPRDVCEAILVDGVHIPAHANVGAQEEDIITALLVRRPIERLGARPDGYPAIFAHPWFANSVTAAVLLRNQTVQPSPYMYEDFEAQLNSSMGTGNYDPGEDAE